MSKADDYNQKQIESGSIEIEHFTELVKQFQLGHGLLADGMCGPSTLSVLGELMRVDLPPMSGWTEWEGPLPLLPTNRTAVYEIFGNPGIGSLNKRWFADNIVELHQSHGNQLPYVPPERYIKCHQKAEPYVRESLRRSQISCPDYVIERFGMFVFRHQQHDKRKPLSYHSFGIAADIDPHKNRAIRFLPDKAPEPWSKEWYEFWPDGLPRGIVEAFESCGFAWGGRWATYVDNMHFELVLAPSVTMTTTMVPAGMTRTKNPFFFNNKNTGV